MLLITLYFCFIKIVSTHIYQDINCHSPHQRYIIFLASPLFSFSYLFLLEFVFPFMLNQRCSIGHVVNGGRDGGGVYLQGLLGNLRRYFGLSQLEWGATPSRGQRCCLAFHNAPRIPLTQTELSSPKCQQCRD